MSAYWHKLLSHFDRKRYFQNGLTLPFIIGSRKFIEPNKKLQSVEEIINDFNSSDLYINILKCTSLGEYVFRISDKDDEKVHNTIDNFVITDLSFSNCKNVSDIISDLSIYDSLTKESKYSKLKGVWQDFHPEIDIPKIMEVK